MSVTSSEAERHHAALQHDQEPEWTGQTQARDGIITPCYNAGAFVDEAIASVDAQTFTDWMHVLVDDGSTDTTAARLEAYSDTDPRRQILHQANKGHAKTRNAIAAQVDDTVDYLLFLDADDILHPRALDTAVSYLDRHPSVGAVHWWFEVVDEEGRALPTHFKNRWHRRHVPTRFGVRVLPDDAAETPLRAILTHCGMIPSCMLVRQSSFASTEGFNDSALFAAGLSDLDLFIQLALRAPIHRVPAVLSKYRAHDDQVTADIKTMDRQYEKLLRRWRGIAMNKQEGGTRLRRALLFAECRKPTADRVSAAACEWGQGAYGTAARVWGGAIVRYLWSLLPSRIAAPLYLKLRAWAEPRGADG
ncbi:MAG: glycosyltransferase [Salinibacter sp.]